MLQDIVWIENAKAFGVRRYTRMSRQVYRAWPSLTTQNLSPQQMYCFTV